MPIDQHDPRLLIGARVVATKRSPNPNNPGYDVGDMGVVASRPSYGCVDVSWENGRMRWNTLLENINFLSSDPADQLFN
jgi:hypothetical protein